MPRLIQCLLAASCLAMAAMHPAHAQNAPLRATPDGRPLVLTFSDEFDSFRTWGAPNGVWRTTFGDGSQTGLDRRTLPNNGELELYVDQNLSDDNGRMGLNPFQTHDGYLDIVAIPTPALVRPRLNNFPYVSGMISSQPSFSQLYGYFEMRAKIPQGKGLWPAFWLLPKDMSWPPEIDVMESIGDSSHIYSTTHSALQPPVSSEANIAPGTFHIFAVSWDKSRIAFFVDNHKIGEQPTPADFHKPMYMIANLAVGGNWPGAPDASTVFPAKMTIDYIRAYQFAHE